MKNNQMKCTEFVRLLKLYIKIILFSSIDTQECEGFEFKLQYKKEKDTINTDCFKYSLSVGSEFDLCITSDINDNITEVCGSMFGMRMKSCENVLDSMFQMIIGSRLNNVISEFNEIIDYLKSNNKECL